MGCFSYMCDQCDTPINSDSFSGEYVKLFLLKDGKVIESMRGQYDSYGRVFDKDNNSIRWTAMEWCDTISLHYDNNQGNGYAATHLACLPSADYEPTTISDDDPDQGWGGYRKRHLEEPA